MKKYIKLYSFLLFTVIISLCCYVGASAEELTWTDAGAYNESWLSEYDKTTEYKINTKEDLAAFLVASKGKYSFENKTVKICSDIDMSDRLWVSAFSSKTAFCGVLDGQGHIISGIRISPDQSEGAFLAKNKGSVTDLCLNVTSSSAKNAGVAIHNEGKIQNVAVSGKLGTELSIVSAGITTKNDGIVENCYSIAEIKVKKGAYSGGICVENNSDISSCFWKEPSAPCHTMGKVSKMEQISEKTSLSAKLNVLAVARGWCTWVDNTSSRFGSYPILKIATDSDDRIAVSGISLSTRTMTMRGGEEKTVEYSIYPENATNKSLIWLSTNEAVVVVNENGKITAVGAGYATVRAITVDGGYIANIAVSVTSDKNIIISESIKLDSVEYKISIGKTTQVRYTVLPEDASVKDVVFEIEDNRVISCTENGVLTALSVGSTVLTVKSTDGGAVSSALVTVIEESYSPVWDGTIAHSFAGGDGSKSNPYIIENAAQLAKIAKDTNSGISYEGVYFKQAINIMLNNTTINNWQQKLTTLHHWTPIGNQPNSAFLGNYDGAGFVINGIYISDDTQAAGLFGYALSGSISNLIIADSIIEGGELCGGIVGMSNSKLVGLSSEDTVSVKGQKYTGGIVGYSHNTINYCINNSIVDGSENVGGIVGYSENAVINSTNFAEVTGLKVVGGICGWSAHLIENCLNSALIYGSEYVGGIAGYSELDVINSHSARFPDAASKVGMLAGYAKRPLRSYSLNTYPACSNLSNREEYMISVNQDGMLVTVLGSLVYNDVLNKHIGCLTTDTYYEWAYNENLEIILTNNTKTHYKINDAESNVKLSGTQIKLDLDFSFVTPKDDIIASLIEKSNFSKIFSNKKLKNEDILFIRDISSKDQIYSLDYKLSLPIDLNHLQQSYSQLKDYELFSKFAVINSCGNETFVFVAEYIDLTSDGSYVGAMKCLYHVIENAVVTSNTEFESKVPFVYENGLVSFTASRLGTWSVVELGDNEDVTPIETAPAEVTLPLDADDTQSFDFDILIVIVVWVLLCFAALGIIVFVRSKNNRLIYPNIDD